MRSLRTLSSGHWILKIDPERVWLTQKESGQSEGGQGLATPLPQAPPLGVRVFVLLCLGSHLCPVLQGMMFRVLTIGCCPVMFAP